MGNKGEVMNLIPLQILFLQELIYSLESGLSLRDSLLKYIQEEKNSSYKEKTRDPFFLKIQIWVKQQESGLAMEDWLQTLKSPVDRQIFGFLYRGIKGESILNHLRIFESELQQRVSLKREQSLSLLSTKLLLPLILLIFPAYLIMLLGPILSEFHNLFK
jgi:hypothetical protein